MTRLPKLILLLLLSAGCSEQQGVAQPPAEPAAATYVGSERCGTCHEDAYTLWAGSHHAAAMVALPPGKPAAPVPSTAGSSEVRRVEGVLAIHSPDGTHPITHTFGITPLQQYLVAGERGRLQAWNYAWDTRPAEAGGQRWFDLYEDAAPEPGEALHWLGRGQTWNHMCADCHATQLVKGYELATDTYSTTAAEMTVGCEACHGPGSSHAAEPAGYSLQPWPDANRLVDTCAPCHSRRAEIAEGFQPGEAFLDHYAPVTLDPPLYTTDAQIQDEVYVWGSFTSSRMYDKGVTCSNCHEPHSAGLRLQGDALCTQCHNPAGNAAFPSLSKARYDDPAHHFHPPATEAARCVTCHMPERTYMSVDPRRDHGFRPPRPDLGDDVRTPCVLCHDDQTNAWAAGIIADRLGPQRTPNLAEALHRGEESDLAQLAIDSATPSALRATALARLGEGSAWGGRNAIYRGLADDDAFVRLGAVRAIARVPEQERPAALRQALNDPVRAVRLEATVQALALTTAPLPEPARAEYIATQTLNADTPEAHVNLAMLHTHEADHTAAESALEQALRIEPAFAPALVNLSELYRQTGRDQTSEPLLSRAADTGSAEASYAYGLWLVRQKRGADALQQFNAASSRAPHNPQYVYALVLSLQNLGRRDEAMATLTSALDQTFAESADLAFLAAALNRDAGNLAEAARWAERLVALNDPRGNALLQQLQR